MGVLEEIRARRTELKEADHYKDYEVPGYERKLVVRFNPVPDEAASEWQAARFRKVAGQDVDFAHVDADTIVKSCREILRRENGKLVPLVDGEETTFATADVALGFETESAVDTVREVFPSTRSIRNCAGELMDWTEGLDEAADQHLVGESKGGPSSSRPPQSSSRD